MDRELRRLLLEYPGIRAPEMRRCLQRALRSCRTAVEILKAIEEAASPARSDIREIV
jgi:hypothetical protein